jgi:hypothetical protein
VDGEQVQSALEHILRSRHFAQTPRLSAFLRLVVEKTLRGESDDIKEYVIGAEVYERDANYDPRVDSIVRVEASRLRARLRTYYEADGAEDAVRIELPKGSYVPTFQTVPVPARPSAECAPVSPAVSRRTWLIGAGTVAAVGSLLVALRNRGSDVALPVALLMTSERALRGGWSTEAEDLSLQLERSLSGVPGLGVLRSASLQEMSAQATVRRDASHYLRVLTAQCREAPGRLRVVMELRRAATDEALWSWVHDDVASRRASLANEAARESRRVIEQFTAKHRDSAQQQQALELHARARRILHRGKDFLLQTGDEMNAPWPLAELLEAIRFLERARLEDPGLVAAHSALAWLYHLASEYDRALFAKSREAVDAALKLDGGAAEANFVKGYSALFEDWDIVTAERCLRNNLNRSILHLHAYRHYVDAALLTGHPDRAAGVLDTAFSVLPRSFQLTFPAASLANFRRDYVEVERLARETLTLRPDMLPARGQLAVALARQEKFSQAEDIARDLVAGHPSDMRAALTLARIYAFQGRRREALKAVAASNLEKRAPATVGVIHAYCGDLDEAFRWLGQAVRQHDNSFPYTVLDPVFSRLETDTRAKHVFKHLRLHA